MSKRRNYSPETLAIMQRFYDALDTCIENGLLKNISRFCAEYDIDKRHLYAQRKNLNKGLFQMSWMLPLVEDCNVSSDWLLLGRGKMFAPRRKPQQPQEQQGQTVTPAGQSDHA